MKSSHVHVSVWLARLVVFSPVTGWRNVALPLASGALISSASSAAYTTPCLGSGAYMKYAPPSPTLITCARTTSPTRTNDATSSVSSTASPRSAMSGVRQTASSVVDGSGVLSTTLMSTVAAWRVMRTTSPYTSLPTRGTGRRGDGRDHHDFFFFVSAIVGNGKKKCAAKIWMAQGGVEQNQVTEPRTRKSNGGWELGIR